MEDKKKKKEDKKKRDSSQKVPDPKIKVPEAAKPPTIQPPSAPGPISPGPPPTTSSSGGPGASLPPPDGGNNVKQRAAVATGQPSSSSSNSSCSSSSSSSGSQASSTAQRYIPREVPPRFRCQQDHKVLLKRGQPPLSSMLLGGGAGGGGAGGGATPPPLSSQSGETPPAGPIDLNPGSSYSSSPSVAAAASSTTSSYANSTWGAGSGSQPPSQGWEKVIVDGSDLEAWPSILGGAKPCSGGTGGGASREQDHAPNSSASWNERNVQQKGVGEVGGGDHPSSPPSPPPPSSSSLAECAGGSPWGSSPSESGTGSDALNNSNMSHLGPGSQKSPGGSCSSSSGGGGGGPAPGPGFNPSTNPSAWPALGPEQTQGPGDGLRPSTSPLPPSSGSQPGLQQQQAEGPGAGVSGGGEPWGGPGAEQGPQRGAGTGATGLGPNQGSGGDGGANRSGSSSSSSSSSWRAMPPTSSSEITAGVSPGDGWGSGGQIQEDKAWGSQGDTTGWGQPDSHGETTGWGQPASQGDTTGWGQPSDSSSTTPGASQGAGEGGGTGESGWGGSGNTAIGTGGTAQPGGRGGSNSSSSGGSGGVGGGALQDSASTAFASGAKAWDNQTAEEKSGERGRVEWGGAGEGGRQTGVGGGVAGAGSSAGGGAPNQKTDSSGGPSSQPTPNAEVALKSMLSRSDLDPRVLSNVGWGQTQIRQNVAWDMEASAAAAAAAAGGGKLKDKSSSSSSSSSTNTTRGSGYSGANVGSKTTEPPTGGGSGSSSGPGPKRDSWDGAVAHQPGRGPHMEAGNRRKAGSPVGNSEGNPAKTAGGWGGLAPESQGKPWGGEEPQEWRDHRGGGGGGGGWRDGGEQGRGGWGAPPENKGTGGWKDVGGGGPSGGGGGGRDWGQRESKPGGMWGEGRGGGRMNSEEGSSWGDEGGPQRGGWGGGDAGGGGGGGSKPHQEWGGGKPHGPPAQTPNSQVAPMKAPNQQQQQHQSQGQQPAMAGGWGGRPSTGPPPPSKSQNQSPGWTSGPVPRAAGPGGGVGGVDPAESSGWEEPSPQSISRKMEIDDGTSAWGDPQRYSHKNVNMWDKNSGSGGQGSGGPGSGGPGHGQQGPSPPNPQQPPRRQPPNRESGNSAVGMWGKGGGQPDDTSAGGWGQSSSSSPSAAPAGWGDPDPDPGKPSGWGNPSANPGKPGPKSGEGWGSKGEGPVAASRHSSWDEEEEGSVWNSGGSQGGWGHGHGGARGHVKGGRGESWGNPMSRQFANMGLLGDDPGGDKKMEGDKRGMSDYNGEMRRGRGGGGYRMPGSKDIVAGDMGHYGDKMSGHGVYGGGGGGGGMPPSRGMHQPGGHPMTPTQGLRAQVPHQYMSAQVPGSMMKQMPSPGNSIGGGGGVGGVGGGGGAGAGGVFPPQLSPQQLAMLSNIYPHVQQFHLACQLLLQQQQQQHQQQQQLLQNQRKFPQPLRQQTDPQQLARIMAVLQQQRQQQGGGGGGSSKLSPSHLGGGGLPKQPMTGDPLSHPGGGGVSLSDFHAKTQAMYSGLAPGGNLSGLDLGQGGGPGMKDPGGGQQSRFKWMMEGHSPSSSSPDAIAAMHKNGPIPNPMKNRGGSPYSQYEMLGPEGLGLPPQGPMDHWHRSPGTKMPHKPGPPSWPPEFQPGVPWKGIPSAGDPESDPFMTPGSVMNPPGPQSLQDSDHPLLRDNTGPNCSLPTSLPSSGAWPYSASDGPLANAHSSAKYSEYKPSWPPEPIGHNKLWKTNRISSQLPRPPPGLSSQKQAQPSPWGSGGPRLARGWGGGGGGGGASQDSRFSQGSAWSDGLASRGSCWLLLSNLTPQIDGSTLRTICMQHGPLLTFHLGLTQGSALIRYSSPQEAAKAQGALHMCVLGNTTILAEFVSEEEVARYFAHSQAGGGDGGPTGSAPGGPQGSSGPGPSVASSGGSSPGSERGPATPGGGGGGGGAGGVGGSTVLSTGSGWQNLDGSGSSSEGSGAPGPGLGVFSQWSTNGTGDGAGPGGAEPGGRPGMWGAVTVGYPGGGGSMWGTPQIEERHQMDNPAALLPGDLLGGGADSI